MTVGINGVYVLDEREKSYVYSFTKKLIHHQNAALKARGNQIAYHNFHVDCARTNIRRIREGRLEELIN
jgi:hypothetical protein